MSVQLLKLEKQAIELPEIERLELAKSLLESLTQRQSGRIKNRNSLKGLFNQTGITDTDLSEAKNIWQ